MNIIDSQVVDYETRIAHLTGSASEMLSEQDWSQASTNKPLAQSIPLFLIAAFTSFTNPTLTISIVPRPNQSASSTHTWKLIDRDEVVPLVDDVEFDSPTYLSEELIALRSRGYKRINDPRKTN